MPFVTVFSKENHRIFSVSRICKQYDFPFIAHLTFLYCHTEKKTAPKWNFSTSDGYELYFVSKKRPDNKNIARRRA
jgi:hypothetical protein